MNLFVMLGQIGATEILLVLVVVVLLFGGNSGKFDHEVDQAGCP